MELYAIIGLVAAVFAFIIWIVVKLSRLTTRSERAEHRAEAEAHAREKIEEGAQWATDRAKTRDDRKQAIRDRIRNGQNKPTEPYLPTASSALDPADAKTARLKKSHALLPLALLLLATSTGCTRTVVVDVKPPPIPTETPPSLDAPKEDWQVFGLLLLEDVQAWNEEFAQ